MSVSLSIIRQHFLSICLDILSFLLDILSVVLDNLSKLTTGNLLVKFLRNFLLGLWFDSVPFFNSPLVLREQLIRDVFENPNIRVVVAFLEGKHFTDQRILFQ